MALSPDQLSGLLRLLSAAEAGVNPLPQIRAALPGITVTRCDAEDMRGELPYRRSGGYDLFLVDTASHCWRIVDDLQAAGGIVLAAHA
jgi:hypothetical protein